MNTLVRISRLLVISKDSHLKMEVKTSTKKGSRRREAKEGSKRITNKLIKSLSMIGQEGRRKEVMQRKRTTVEATN